MACDGTGRGEARKGKIGALDQLEFRRQRARALNRRTADLAIALGRMSIADAEQPARHFDREVKLGTDSKIADIHIAAHAAGRNDRVEAGRGGSQADSSAEGLERHAPARPIHRRRKRRRIIGPDVERRLLELIGEEPEARNIGGPAPARWREGEERHLDGIARFSTIDMNGPCHRIDLTEIEPRNIGNGRFRGELAARGIDGMKFDRLAGRCPRDRRIGVRPAEMALMLMDRMVVLHCC